MKDPIIRVALITGCGQADGIGSATARAIAKTGIPIVVTDVELSGVANDLDVRSAEVSTFD
jgi:NAD(P)-dependent dehydrogenase (short-subunit alcohol dehydrogenase family)